MTGSMRYYICEDEWIDQNDGSYHWQFWRSVCVDDRHFKSLDKAKEALAVALINGHPRAYIKGTYRGVNRKNSLYADCRYMINGKLEYRKEYA